MLILISMTYRQQNTSSSSLTGYYHVNDILHIATVYFSTEYNFDKY